MQSTLHNNILVFPNLISSLGPLTKLRQGRVILIYIALYMVAGATVLALPHSYFAALGHSLVFPGSGFLAGVENSVGRLSLSLFLLSLSVLAVSGFLWFATGNVLLPPVVWVLISVGSGVWHSQKQSMEFELWTTIVAFSVGPIFIVSLYAYRMLTFKRGRARRTVMNQLLSQEAPKIDLEIVKDKEELSLSELQDMRLLLDRALQPLDEFEGFEWIDQFQTSAIRYQINFISYALSLAQANYMPAFTGYISQSQMNLKAKQENHRIWKYWYLENLWGNLCGNADPIARDNIMYSGFVGAQLAFARQLDPRNIASLNGLTCQNGTDEFSYSQDEIIRGLVSQYEAAKYGLLSCEPNWVYPLCNAITASAIRAHDAREGTAYWESISAGFRRSLETEFMTPSGQLIPFRSNYTGFAPPQVGGAVMQAFPCFFLNSILPDIAQRQWKALQIDMQGQDWRKKLWPVDVGNYGFSRASSYAATALAAREMGDNNTADLLLEYLEEDCPRVLNDGVAHYSKASLWANANAFMAKINQKNAFQRLVTKPKSEKVLGPYLAHVDPSEVMVAKAKYERGILSIIAYPTNSSGFKQLKLAGLTPHAFYQITSSRLETFKALEDGTQAVNCALNGRTEITISNAI